MRPPTCCCGRASVCVCVTDDREQTQRREQDSVAMVVWWSGKIGNYSVLFCSMGAMQHLTKNHGSCILHFAPYELVLDKTSLTTKIDRCNVLPETSTMPTTRIHRPPQMGSSLCDSSGYSNSKCKLNATSVQLQCAGLVPK